jgi:hypothetical protein
MRAGGETERADGNGLQATAGSADARTTTVAVARLHPARAIRAPRNIGLLTI